MNKYFGIALTVAAFVAGTVFFGWKGAIVALSGVVFYLLLQFSQLMKVMRTANASPLGHVSSAIMLQSRLHVGMKLVDLIKLTRSLGEKVGPETYRWTDAGADAVDVVMARSLVVSWTLVRAADVASAAPGSALGSASALDDRAEPADEVEPAATLSPLAPAPTPDTASDRAPSAR
ncbi:hypothetical protein [Roseateles amylovorans]|uniref:Glycerate kinase n=1 Tax=Roseateles amylovorans TaxID=2978473 RepID=A0ABY6B0D0_9BURK|nr:hypothetical protein [Roseateles amylovorans]UXH78652.1 hypothetical protein N4261_01550 [Roseateles amylovorans]